MAAYSANQLRACSSSLGGKNFTGARRTPAPAKASARVSQRGSATTAILEILPPCEIRKSRSFQSAPHSQPSKFSRMTSKRGFDPVSILRDSALCSAPNSDCFKIPLIRRTQTSLGSYWIFSGISASDKAAGPAGSVSITHRHGAKRPQVSFCAARAAFLPSLSSPAGCFWNLIIGEVLLIMDNLLDYFADVRSQQPIDGYAHKL